jgi:acyl carrier protein
MSIEEIKQDLKIKIIEELHLENVTPDEIIDDAPLFGKALGLDSIDAIELVLILEKQYQIKIPNETRGKEILTSVQSITDFIVSQVNTEA